MGMREVQRSEAGISSLFSPASCLKSDLYCVLLTVASMEVEELRRQLEMFQQPDQERYKWSRVLPVSSFRSFIR